MVERVRPWCQDHILHCLHPSSNSVPLKYLFWHHSSFYSNQITLKIDHVTWPSYRSWIRKGKEGRQLVAAIDEQSSLDLERERANADNRIWLVPYINFGTHRWKTEKGRGGSLPCKKTSPHYLCDRMAVCIVDPWLVKSGERRESFICSYCFKKDWVVRESRKRLPFSSTEYWIGFLLLTEARRGRQEKSGPK